MTHCKPSHSRKVKRFSDIQIPREMRYLNFLLMRGFSFKLPFAGTQPRTVGRLLHTFGNGPFDAVRTHRRRLRRFLHTCGKLPPRMRSHAPSILQRSGRPGRSPCPKQCTLPSRRRALPLNTLLRSCHMRWRMRCMHRYSFEKNSFPCRSPNVRVKLLVVRNWVASETTQAG